MTTTENTSRHWGRQALELMGVVARPERPTLLVQYRLAALDRQLARQQALDAERRRALGRPY